MRRGFSLVSTLITLVIMCMLGIALFYGSGAFGGAQTSERPDGKGKTVLGAVKAEAEDEVCRSNLNQVRLALQTAQAQDPDSALPATLEETRIGSNFYKCPMAPKGTVEPYQYDPATGTVRCPHPGHEAF